jgi:spermidine/putrescine transport system ATP-binding protein
MTKVVKIFRLSVDIDRYLSYFSDMLRTVNMSKKFASQTAVDQVSIEIREGEFFSLLGPSGCGKTTLLRMIAGFESPTSGELFWDSVRIDPIPPQNRPFNMVFQRYALFPHLSVFENVAFGLRVKDVEEGSLSKRVTEALKMVGLHEFTARLPETLSGGQAQRVAVARALVNEPKILLLDEPLSALDQKMREHMQTELRQLQRRLGITFILVTHDQEEALALSDRIAVMNHGRIEQVATPRELYEAPRTHFVAQFVGSMGSLWGITKSCDNENAVIQTRSGKLLRGRGKVDAKSAAEAFVRPENVRLGEAGAEANSVIGKVSNIAFKGLHFELQLEIEEQKMRMFVRPEIMPGDLKVGAIISVNFSVNDTFVFERPQA